MGNKSSSATVVAGQITYQKAYIRVEELTKNVVGEGAYNSLIRYKAPGTGFFSLLPAPRANAPINRHIEWTKFQNGHLYQGEVDAQGNPDGLGITIIPNESVCFAIY